MGERTVMEAALAAVVGVRCAAIGPAAIRSTRPGSSRSDSGAGSDTALHQSTSGHGDLPPAPVEVIGPEIARERTRRREGERRTCPVR